MPRFSYIHLSDTHFCIEPVRRNALGLMRRLPRNRIDTYWRQMRTIGYLSLAKPASYIPEILIGAAQFCLERPSVDGVIFTGDLATTGMMTDLLVARSFVSEPAADGFVTENGSPTLNVGSRNIYVLPGNHDKYINPAGAPNCIHFAMQFGSLMRNYRDGVGHWVRRKGNAHVGFIYADFTLQTRMDASDKFFAVYGQGRVKEEVLRELKDRSFDLRRRFEKITLVWVLHFAPFDCGYSLRLHDYGDFIDAAISLRVAATICGHTHRASKTSVDGHTILCAGSTGCVDAEEDSRIQVLHFDVGKEIHIQRENYIWSSNEQEFVFLSRD